MKNTLQNIISTPRFRYFALLAVLATTVLMAAVGYAVTRNDTGKTEDGNPEDNTQVHAVLTEASGNVSISRNGGMEGITIDQELFAEESITTGNDSRAVITFPDGSLVRIDQQSTVALTSVTESDYECRVEKGTVYVRTAVSDERTFTAHVGNEEMTTTDAAFLLINRDEKSQLKVVYGSTEVASPDKTLSVKQGSVKGPNGKVRAFDQEDMNDAFLIWNKEQDEMAFPEQLGIFSEELPAPKKRSQ